MSRVTDVLDAFLGTPTYRGGVVRNRSGVYTNADGLEPADGSFDGLVPRSLDSAVDPCSPRSHGRLKGRRCHGCGRTWNEIALDEGS